MSIKQDIPDLSFLIEQKAKKARERLSGSGPGQGMDSGAPRRRGAGASGAKRHSDTAPLRERKAKPIERFSEENDLTFEFDINDEIVDLAAALNLDKDVLPSPEDEKSTLPMKPTDDLQPLADSNAANINDEQLPSEDAGRKSKEPVEEVANPDASVKNEPGQLIDEIEAVPTVIDDESAATTAALEDPADSLDTFEPEASSMEQGSDASVQLGELFDETLAVSFVEGEEERTELPLPATRLDDPNALIEALEPAAPAAAGDEANELIDLGPLLTPAADGDFYKLSSEATFGKPPPSSSLDEDSGEIALQSDPTEETSIFSDFLQESQGKETIVGGISDRQAGKDKASGQQGLAVGRATSMSFSALFENVSLLGLDFGVRSCKYIRIKKSARGVRLIAAGNFAAPPVGEDNLGYKDWYLTAAQFLSRNIDAKHLKNVLVATAVSGMEVVFKNVEVPKMSRKDLARAVPWACRKDFPFPIEATAFEFRVIENSKKKPDSKLDVLVVAAQKEFIEQQLQGLAEAKVTPAKISTIPAALWQTFLLCASKDISDKPHALVDIGHRSSHVTFVNEKQLQFARELSIGGSDFIQALTGDLFIDGKELSLGEAEAEQIICRYGIPQEGDQSTILDGVAIKEVAVLLWPQFERLASDIQRTMEFYKEKFKVETLAGIYLSGGGALMPNLADMLHGQLGLAVEKLNPFDVISAKKHPKFEALHQVGPSFAVAVGLALDDSRELNLLPERLKESYFLRYLKRIFRYFIVVFILLMAFLSQDVTREFRKIQVEFQRLNAEFVRGEPRRKKFLQLQQAHKTLREMNRQFANSIDIDLEAAGHLKAISHFIPANMALTSLRIKWHQQDAEGEGGEDFVRKVMMLEGVAFPDDSMEGMALAGFLMKMEESGYFAAIKLRSQRLNDDGSLQFSIECEL